MPSSAGDLAINVSTNTASVEQGFNKLADVVQQRARSMEASVDGLNSKIEAIGSALKLLTGIASIGAGFHLFAEMITGAIDAQAKLQDLADKVGSTASQISSLIPAARLSGTSLEDVAQASAKFSKTLLDVQAGNGKAAESFKALGLTANDAGRYLQNPTQGLFELAKKMQGFANDGNLAAVRMELLGKSAANLAPFLKQLAEQQELTARVTDQQAQAAKVLGDQWATLGLRSEELRNSIAAGIVPELSRLVDAFTAATAAPGGLRDKIKELADEGSLAIWIHNTAIALVTAGESFVVVGKALYAFAGSVKVVANDITVAALAVQVAQGNLFAVGELKKALAQRESDLADANGRWSRLWNDNATSVSDSLKKQLTDMEAFREAARKTVIQSQQALRDAASNQGERFLQGSSLAAFKPKVDTSGITSGGGDGAKKIDEFGKALERFRQMAAAADAQLRELLDGRKITAAQKAFEQLKVSDVWKLFTDGQKRAIEALAKGAEATERQIDLITRLRVVTVELDKDIANFAGDYAQKFATLNEAFNAGKINLEEFQRLVQKLLAQQPYALREAEAWKKLSESILVGVEALQQMQEAEDAAIASFHVGQSQAQQDLDFQLSLIGKTAVEQEKLNAFRRIDLELQRTLAALSPARLAEEGDGLRRNAELAKGAVAATIEQRAALESGRETLRNLADAGAHFIEDFVQHGASAFKNLWESFKGWALAAFAKIAAQKVIVSLAGSIGLGAAGNAFAGGLGNSGGLGGIGDLFSVGSSLSGIGSAASAGFASGFAGFTGAASAGVIEAGSIAGGIGASASGIGAGISGGLAAGLAAVPVAGWVALAAIVVAGIIGGLDKGPAQRTASFGSNAGLGAGNDKFQSQSALGTFGIFNDKWFSEKDQGDAIRQFLASLQSIDNAIAGFLDSATVQRIKDNLAAATTEFEAGIEHEATSFGEVIQQRYSVVAHSIDEELGSLVDAFQGTGAELAKFVTGIVGVHATLSKLGTEGQTAIFGEAVSTTDFADLTAAGGDVAATFQNLVAVFTLTNTVANLLGEDMAAAFGEVGLASAELRQNFVDLLGGIQGAQAALANWVQVGFTDAERRIMAVADGTKTLNRVFGELNQAVPESWSQLNKLIAAQDLSTEAGSKAAAMLIQEVVPAFNLVHGPAQDAVDAVNAQAEANHRLVQSAEEFFGQNFFSDAEKQAQQLAVYTKQITDAQTSLGIAIPNTLEGFRDLVLSFHNGSEAGEEMYRKLIVLAPAIFGVANAAGAAATKLQEAATQFNGISIGTIGKTIGDEVRTALTQIYGVIDQGTGDFAEKLGAKVTAVGKGLELAQQAFDNLSDYEKYSPDSAARFAANLRINTYTAENNKLTAQLARFVTLTAQFDSARAEQLVGLETWYEDQKKALRGNTIALAGLQTLFGQKWQGIIDGVAGGVDGTLSELDKLRQGILDYISKLKTSNLSPLKPLERLAEAQSQYEAKLAAAQGGDTGALKDITKFADTYLQLARDAFASSSAYTDRFNAVVSQLEGLTQPQVAIDPTFAADQANAAIAAAASSASPLDSVLPTGSKLASSADSEAVRGEVAQLREAVVALAGVMDSNGDRMVDTNHRSALRIVDSIRSGSR